MMLANILNEPRWVFGIDEGSIPAWFSGYDAYVQLVLFAIALLVALYSYRFYKLSHNRDSYYFGMGFMMLAGSYLLWSVLNFTFVAQAGTIICNAFTVCTANLIVDISIYVYELLFISGLLMLAYSTVEKLDKATLSLIFILIVTVLLFSIKVLFFFYALSTILLLYLVWQYILSYHRKPNSRKLLVIGAFSFMTLANVEFLLGLTSTTHYVLGNVLVLLAYSLILANLVSIARK